MSDVASYPLHPAQWRAVNSDRRFIGFIGGSGSGKSYCLSKWLYKELVATPGTDSMIVSPTFSMLEDIALGGEDGLWNFFEGTDLEGKDRGIRSHKRYDFPDGSRCYYRSADNPQSLEGTHVGRIVADEVGMMKEDIWDIMMRRVARSEGRIFISTTPYASQPWLKDRFMDRALVETFDIEGNIVKTTKGSDPENYHVVQCPSALNPSYSNEEFQRLKETMTEEEFQMYYMGKFTRLQGLVYPDFQDVVVDYDTYMPTEADKKIGAIDPGVSDPFGVITAVYGQDDKLHLRYEVYESDMLLRDLAEYLDPYATYYMDPAARREREELQADGYDIQKAVNDIGPGIRKVNEFIKDGRLVIPKNDFPNLISEARTYQYSKKKDKPDKSTPHHLLDCLRYLLMGLEDDGNVDIYIL